MATTTSKIPRLGKTNAESAHPRRRRSRATGLVMFALGLVPVRIVTASTEAPSQDDFVLIQRVIDTRYDLNSKASSDYLAQLSSSLQRTYVVKPNDTFQGIATQLFHIGPKAAEKQYSLLADRVAQLNGISDLNNLSAGKTLIVPDLAPKHPNTGPTLKFLNIAPRVSASPSLTMIQSGHAFNFDANAFTQLPSISPSATTPIVSQWRWVPRATAIAEQAQGNAGTVRAARLSVTLADAAQAAENDDAAPDVSFLRTLLVRKKPTHASVVYVLDDSWGDQKAFAAARDYFVTAAQDIRKAFALGPAEWNSGLASAKAQTDFPFDQDNRASHARQVSIALQPFSQITSSVQVVYVPLFVEQKWSSEFLHEVLRTAFTAWGKGAGLEDGLAPEKALLDAARKNADDVTSRLPSKVVNSVAQTDQAVILSLLLFAQLHARATGVPFFVSLSWTAPQYQFAFGPDPNSLGMPLAAVGNTIGYDVFSNKVLLSMRAREYPGDVLAVMNAHTDGRVDCSSQWVAPSSESVYGLTYSGFLPDGTCGTSFSTPRVAWWLALREGFNPLVLSAAAQSGWLIQYRHSLLQLQNPQAPGFRRYLLVPSRLFSGI